MNDNSNGRNRKFGDDDNNDDIDSDSDNSDDQTPNHKGMTYFNGSDFKGKRQTKNFELFQMVATDTSETAPAHPQSIQMLKVGSKMQSANSVPGGTGLIASCGDSTSMSSFQTQ